MILDSTKKLVYKRPLNVLSAGLKDVTSSEMKGIFIEEIAICAE